MSGPKSIEQLEKEHYEREERDHERSERERGEISRDAREYNERIGVGHSIWGNNEPTPSDGNVSY